MLYEVITTVNVDSGVMQLGGGGTHSGAFNIAAGAELAFYGGTHELNAGTTVTGPGLVRAYNGTTNINAGADLADNTALAIDFATVNLV